MDDRRPASGRPDREVPPAKSPDGGRSMRIGLGYILLALLMLWLFQALIVGPMNTHKEEVPYSEFRDKLAAGQVSQVRISNDEITGKFKPPSTAPADTHTVFVAVYAPGQDRQLVADLQAAGVRYTFQRPASPIGGLILAWVLPIALMVALYSFAFRRLGRGVGGAGGIFGVGKSKAVVVRPEQVGVTFKDVGGADEAIAELREIIEFLMEPERFAMLGARTPKGVLLVGPPGTGKTLLAKATAGEARVAFFETSGPEFVEMFVGVGAARVRDTFEQARLAAPAIIFIDEIDAIGQSRGGLARFGNNDEREQTLNQLLAEIDGFKADVHRPVIIMAATNRPEVLDQALLRAGRFDRQVVVGNPDLAGRVQILKIHTRTIRLARDFDLERAARMTPGFSGADLENLVNEAALLAARRKAEGVTLGDFEAAIERVVAGVEQKTHVMNDLERRTVATHESGHALVGALMPHGAPISRISIVPRSRGSLGYTMQMPTEDRYLLTCEELEERIAVMLGGRAAERLVLGTVSTGASDDIQKATELARRMVAEFGMSERLGSVRYAGRQLQFLGGGMVDDSDASQQTREVIDREVQRIVTEQYERAQALLHDRRAALEALAAQLLTQETVEGEVVKRILAETTAETAPALTAPTPA